MPSYVIQRQNKITEKYKRKRETVSLPVALSTSPPPLAGSGPLPPLSSSPGRHTAACRACRGRGHLLVTEERLGLPCLPLRATQVPQRARNLPPLRRFLPDALRREPTHTE